MFHMQSWQIVFDNRSERATVIKEHCGNFRPRGNSLQVNYRFELRFPRMAAYKNTDSISRIVRSETPLPGHYQGVA